MDVDTLIPSPKVKIIGICQRSEYIHLKSNLLRFIKDSQQTQIRFSIVPPVFVLAKIAVFSSDGLIERVVKFVRRSFTLFVQDPRMLIPGLSKLTLTIEFNRLQEDVFVNALNQLSKTYFSNLIYPTVNLMPNNLTLSHQQVLEKRLKDFRIYLLYVKTSIREPIRHRNVFEKKSKTPVFQDSNSAEVLEIPSGNFQYYCVRDATFAHGTCIFDKEKFYFVDSARIELPLGLKRGVSAAYKTENGIRVLPFKIIGELKEAVLVGGTNNIMHFVLEDLIRVQKMNKLISENIPILINGSMHTNIINALRDISGREVIACASFQGLMIDKLHMFMYRNPLPKAMQGDTLDAKRLFTSADMNLGKFVRNRLNELDKLYDMKPLNRVIITREKGLFREMKNQDELVSILTNSFGFKALNPGELSFDELARALHETEILIGQYGAGLANAIFLKPGSKVIQIKGPRDIDCLEYSALFDHLGLQEFIVEHRHKTISRLLNAPGNFNVNVGKVRKILDFL